MATASSFLSVPNSACMFNKSVESWNFLGGLCEPYLHPSKQPLISIESLNIKSSVQQLIQHNFHILTIPPNVIGEQLCLFESILFNSIDINDLHIHFKKQKEKREKEEDNVVVEIEKKDKDRCNDVNCDDKIKINKYSQNLTSLLSFSDSFTHWISSELSSVKQDDKQQKMEVLCRAIELAHFCLVNNCYAAVFDIYEALSSSTAIVLEDECKTIPQKYKELLNSVVLATSPADDYKEYNTRMKILSKDVARNAHRLVTGVIPHIKYYVKKIEDIDRDESDFVGEGVINFRKYRKLGEIFLEVKSFQETRYTDFKPRDDVLYSFKKIFCDK